MFRNENDLSEILERASDDIRAFAGAHIFVTGGTGFVGRWLLESIVWANARAHTGIRVSILARNLDAARERLGALAALPEFTLVQGDVFGEPSRECFDGVLHAATQPADGAASAADPRLVYDAAVIGTRHALAVAANNGNVPMLFTSSGAVYGKQPRELEAVSEGYSGSPDQLNPSEAYGEGKRAAELQIAIATAQNRVQGKIARLFAFIGPNLPMDRVFAAGNFLGDALAGREIAILGDGTPVRSYLYASEMAVWLWAVFARGTSNRAYNVGSQRAVSIEDLARAVADTVTPTLPVRIAKSATPGVLPDRYVPDVARITKELGVVERVGLRESIARTLAYYR